MCPVLEDFVAQVQAGSPPRRGFFWPTGEVALCVDLPVTFFSAPRADSVAFPLLTRTSQAAGVGQPRPTAPDPKSSLLIQRGSRERTPTASFYQITPFAGAAGFERGASARPSPDRLRSGNAGRQRDPIIDRSR